MDDDIRRRSACDRCHSQKLRCPKRQGTDICDRCAKSASSCVYSPFRQKKEPHIGQPSTEARVPPSNADESRSRPDLGSSSTSNRQKRKRINPASEDPDLANGPNLSCSSVQADAAPLCDGIEEEWSSHSLDAFQDLMSDQSFVDLDFENQNDFPRLDFNLPAFSKYGNKLDDLLHLSSPPLSGHSFPSALSSRPHSPLTASFSSPYQMTVELPLPTPQVPMWNGATNEISQRSALQCVRQLSELSAALYEHSTKIPPQSIHDPLSDDNLNQETLNAQAQKYAYYSVDDTFRLTQELIDIYPSFMEIFTKRKIPQSSRSSTIPASSGSYGLEDVLRGEPLGAVVPSISNPLHLDHSSILLILSCHLRLMDIYDELFIHMKVCIDQRGLAYSPQQAYFQAPSLQIGKYVPPMTTSVPMQMLLLLHFATSLCDYATELESHIRQSENGIASSQSETGEDGVAALSLASAQKVKERASGMVQHLGSLRTLMLTIGIA